MPRADGDEDGEPEHDDEGAPAGLCGAALQRRLSDIFCSLFPSDRALSAICAWFCFPILFPLLIRPCADFRTYRGYWIIKSSFVSETAPVEWFTYIHGSKADRHIGKNPGSRGIIVLEAFFFMFPGVSSILPFSPPSGNGDNALTAGDSHNPFNIMQSSVETQLKHHALQPARLFLQHGPWRSVWSDSRRRQRQRQQGIERSLLPAGRQALSVKLQVQRETRRVRPEALQHARRQQPGPLLDALLTRPHPSSTYASTPLPPHPTIALPEYDLGGVSRLPPTVT